MLRLASSHRADVAAAVWRQIAAEVQPCQGVYGASTEELPDPVVGIGEPLRVLPLLLS
jgi:hypothetical protein